jgi:hypothetical protein
LRKAANLHEVALADLDPARVHPCRTFYIRVRPGAGYSILRTMASCRLWSVSENYCASLPPPGGSPVLTRRSSTRLVPVPPASRARAKRCARGCEPKRRTWQECTPTRSRLRSRYSPISLDQGSWVHLREHDGSKGPSCDKAQRR